jgi:hypothetical protein
LGRYSGGVIDKFAKGRSAAMLDLHFWMYLVLILLGFVGAALIVYLPCIAAKAAVAAIIAAVVTIVFAPSSSWGWILLGSMIAVVITLAVGKVTFNSDAAIVVVGAFAVYGTVLFLSWLLLLGLV